MKFAAALLIAVVFTSAVMAAEEVPVATKGMRENLVAKAKELQAKIQAAVQVGKGKVEEVVKELGLPNKEALVAKLNELKAQLQAKLKDVVVPAVSKAKQQAALKLRARLEQAIKRLQDAIAKLQKVQQ